MTNQKNMLMYQNFFSIKLGWKYAFLCSSSSYTKIKGNIRNINNDNKEKKFI